MTIDDAPTSFWEATAILTQPPASSVLVPLQESRGSLRASAPNQEPNSLTFLRPLFRSGTTKKYPAESGTMLSGNLTRVDIGLGASMNFGSVNVTPRPAAAAPSARARLSTTSAERGARPSRLIPRHHAEGSCGRV